MSSLAVVGAQELTETIDCRVFGCIKQAKSSRGRYAYLCERHIKEKQAEEPAPRAAQEPSPARGEAGDAEAPTSLASAVRALERPAKRLERVAKKRKAVRSEATAAVEEFNDALRLVREIAAQLLG